MRSAAKIFIVALVIFMSPALWGAETKPVDTKPTAQKAGIVAIVNGTEIPVIDFWREMLRLERLVLNTGRPLTCPQITRLRTEVAEGLVRRELLYEESKGKVKVSDAEIATEMKKLKDQYPSESDYAAALSSMNVSPASLKAQVERALSIQKFVDQFAAKVSL